MKVLIIMMLIVTIIVVIFKHLIKQSKEPSGIIGSFMMKLWNKTYIPMVRWTTDGLSSSKSGMKILDVGVGNGQSTRYLSEQFPNADLYGIDISDRAVEDAQKLNSRVIYQVKNVKETGYRENYFDFIFAFQTHFHWDDLEGSLIELKRILTSNGKIIISSEISKVKYYLPDLYNNEKFKNDLSELGLELFEVTQNTNWIRYEISKKL